MAWQLLQVHAAERGDKEKGKYERQIRRRGKKKLKF
jgi:hypothetical protein